VLLGGPILGTLVLAGLLVGAWYFVWGMVADDVLRSSQYLVRPENVQITPLPGWIHSDLRAEVYRTAAPDGPLSALDDNLVQRIADAFSLHPWVAQVRRVTKQAGPRVKVELEYRRPVCMVEVSGGVLPVDAEGAWLPSSDFSPVEASRYPRLVGVNTMPLGSVGTRWGDPRVVGGAKIAALLLPAWDELQLQKIVPSASPESGEQYAYDLYTRNGTRILWGRAPGAASPDPVSGGVKLGRLRQYLADHGSLEGPRGPQQIDVRDVRSVQIGPLPGKAPAPREAAKRVGPRS